MNYEKYFYLIEEVASETIAKVIFADDQQEALKIRLNGFDQIVAILNAGMLEELKEGETTND